MPLDLRYYQADAVDAVFDYWATEAGNPLVDLATGCHAAGTEIMMFDGTTKAVELVAANDNLMGPDSQPRRVLRTVRGREMLYLVTPVKGEPFIVNEGHILSLKVTGQGKSRRGTPDKGSVVNVSVRDWLTKNAYWKHCHKLWRAGVNFHANDNEIDIPAWILGAIIGDGCTLYGVSITNPDREILEEVSAYAESIGLHVRISRKPNNKAVDLHLVDRSATSVTPNRLVQKLRAIGAFGARAGEKHIPDAYKRGSVHTRLEVLAGLIDTDGHLCAAGTIDYISKSRRLAEDVVFLAQSLGLAAYVRSCEKFCQTGGGGTYWRVCISGDLQIIPTRVARKRAGPRRQKKNPLVTGFSVEAIGEGDYYGFALDRDHLYLTGDFTVHHNTGKSLVAATLIERLVRGWTGMRIIAATHVAELIEQNYLELMGAWPFAPAGIMSAGLKRYDYAAQILFAGIQTAWNKVEQICAFGPVDVLLVDEAHLIPEDSATQYGAFIAKLREINPDMKIVGLTATPYRLKSGRLDEGDDRLFDRVVYTYGIADGIRDGYLAPLSSKGTELQFDYTGIGKIGGDYKSSAMQDAFDKHEVVSAAVDEIVAKGQGRRSWLCFCAGVEHAIHVRDEIRARGITCETVTGSTPKEERRRILEDFKAYRIQALTNNAVLTTGFNHKGVDLIAAMRGTLSTSLYVQMMGRGTRPLYATGMSLDTPEERKAAISAGPKPNCLVLDFAGLVDEHGPVDRVQPRVPGKGMGEAPIKLCPECDEKCHASARVCPCCGYDFPESEKPKHRASASDAAILSTDEPWRRVTGRTFREHQAKDPTKPNTVRVDYMLGFSAQKEWICPGHTGYPKTKADRYWRLHGGRTPFPKSPTEWLDRADELKPTAEIKLRSAGKYDDVIDWRAGEMQADNDNQEPAANDNDLPTWRYARAVDEDALAEFYDEIPF